MSYQTTFKRYEMKYLLSQDQKQAVLDAMRPYMFPDCYGRTTVRNIYFDTDTFRLIRRSIEHPAYKEKLRVRSYRRAEAEEPVFVELKKKYRSVVYKRRLIFSQAKVLNCLETGSPIPLRSQIADEINYFCGYYGRLLPAVFLSYEREAYCSAVRADLRITFDENILCRQRQFSFEEEVSGERLMDRKKTLMEVKTGGGMPLWLVRCLTEQKLYKTSFSKYGTAYEQIIAKGRRKERTYV